MNVEDKMMMDVEVKPMVFTDVKNESSEIMDLQDEPLDFSLKAQSAFGFVNESAVATDVEGKKYPYSLSAAVRSTSKPLDLPMEAQSGPMSREKSLAVDYQQQLGLHQSLNVSVS